MFDINRCLYMGCGGNIYTGVMRYDWIMLMLTVMAFLFPITLAWKILTRIGEYRVLQHIGENGWKALIPFYREITFFKRLDMKYEGITFIFASIGALLFSTRSEAIYSICAFVALFCILIYYYKIVKIYNHGFWFYMGLVFLQPIFWMILGSEKPNLEIEIDEYKKEEEKVVEEKKEEPKAEPEKRYCQRCGKEVALDAKFCSECGQDLSKKVRKRKK